MKREAYLFDTHALVFWNNQADVSEDYIQYFDKQDQGGNLYVSSVSFWELALLLKKGKIEIEDIHAWKNELLNHTNIQLIDPSATEMINSTLLPDHHKDPFDRLLIAQAKHNHLYLVTKDQHMAAYDVSVFWK